MDYSLDRDKLIKGTTAPTRDYVKRNAVTSARLLTRNSTDLMTKRGTKTTVEINMEWPLRRMSAGNAVTLAKVREHQQYTRTAVTVKLVTQSN